MVTTSNACYDLALAVFLATWRATESVYPMLILHTEPIPAAMNASLLEIVKGADVRYVPVDPVWSPWVKSRYRFCATKFHLWNLRDFEQIAYYDTDHIFRESVDGIFDQCDDTLCAVEEPKSPSEFNAGTMLLQTHKDTYSWLHSLYACRITFLDHLFDFYNSGDQKFMNVVWRQVWQKIPTRFNAQHGQEGAVEHYKVWRPNTDRQRDEVNMLVCQMLSTRKGTKALELTWSKCTHKALPRCT